MFNSTTLEVAIGMALVYLLLSLFCTAINEAIAGILNSRAKNLEKGIKSLFTQGDFSKGVSFTNAIYRHGLIQSLYRSGAGTADTESDQIKKPPSYIPSRTFASALYDILFASLPNTAVAPGGPAQAPETAQASQLSNMLDAIKDLPDSPAKQALRTLVKEANGDVEKTRASFERWYDDGMDRTAGWYKKSTQRSLFLIGLGAAIILNVDTIIVADTLWSSPATRSFAVSYADKIANDTTVKNEVKAAGTSSGTTANSNSSTGATAAQTQPAGETNPNPTISTGIADASKHLEELNSLNLPTGWKEAQLLAPLSKNETTWPQRFRLDLFMNALKLGLLGWLLTAVAMTLGAPFWFDTLNQFMVVRSTIKPREKSDVEGSKDSQKK